MLNYLHGYLNPQNKSRYSYYPKRKLRLIDVWGGKKLAQGDAHRRGFLCCIKKFTGNRWGTFVGTIIAEIFKLDISQRKQ